MENIIFTILGLCIVGIIILIIRGFYFKFSSDDTNKKQELKQKAENMIISCKNIHTFAELKENFSEEHFTYYDLFDLNFDIKSVRNETEITITFYLSEDITREKLFSRLSDPTSLYQRVKLGIINPK